MNERIQQLAKEAGLLFQRDKLSYEELKFAELIVKECIDINQQELSFNAFERLMNRYQKHFGVEQ